MFVYPRDGALVRRYIAEVTPSSPPSSIEAVDTEEVSGSDRPSLEEDEEGEEEQRDQKAAAAKDPSSNATPTTTLTSFSSPPPTTTTTTTRTNQTSPSPGPGPRLILWLGPRCDYDTTGFASLSGAAESTSTSQSQFQSDFESKWEELHEISSSSDVGLAEYEMLAALRLKMG